MKSGELRDSQQQTQLASKSFAHIESQKSNWRVNTRNFSLPAVHIITCYPATNLLFYMYV